MVMISGTFAQDIDTAFIDGKEYFVYPFSITVSSESEYYLAMKKRKANGMRQGSYGKYQKYYLNDLDDGEEQMSRGEYRQFKKLLRSYTRDFGEDSDRKFLNKKFVKAVRNNPYSLLQQRFFENKDLTPVLDPIPDGDYVQFYNDFCIFDNKGECNNRDSIIGGYFSIKDNMLHGAALWIDLEGDTLKYGHFKNGIKEGVWKFENRRAPYAIGKKDAAYYIEHGELALDTTIEIITYRGGVKNGVFQRYANSRYPIDEGFYTNGLKSGEWKIREITFKRVRYKKIRNRNNDLITLRFTYNDNDSLIVHQKWLRDGLISFRGADLKQFNFFSRYEVKIPHNELYEIAFEEEQNLELEEEIDLETYDDLEYELDNLDYPVDRFRFEASDYQTLYYDSKLEKLKKRGVLMDSLGGIPQFTGTYESFYPNGNLMYRYEFKNGILEAEDTVFWDNGLAHDVITFLPDSNQFKRSIYDYDGKAYLDLIYDAKMDFVRIGENYEVEKEIILDGYRAQEAAYGSYYYYNAYDTLLTELHEPLLLYRSWFTEDSSLMYSSNYDPAKRVFSNDAISVMGNLVYDDKRAFSEDFESWTGKRSVRMGSLELVNTSSGSLHEWITPDTIPQNNVQYSHERFDVAKDYMLLKDGENYTGEVSLNFSKSQLSVSKKGMIINFPSEKGLASKLSKDLERYQTKGKTKYPLIMSFIDPTETETSMAQLVFSTFFGGPLQNFFNPPYEQYTDDYEPKRRNKAAVISAIEGYMLNGKAHGLWVSYDQFGNKMLALSYKMGEPHGEFNQYQYAFPKEKEELGLFGYEEETLFEDSLPEKKTYYTSTTKHFVNGKAQGREIIYNWYGDIMSSANYIDGYLDGLSMERNMLAQSNMSYANGQLDGYYQTYLTLPNRDSILLFNLNFQDGLLQGESKSYHTNGNISKRGFFLNGNPIEDYEAYDSLGFKYHYVKFKYSYPVEERIWEENELSVRYLFDWEDSIRFEPTDITTSQSLEATLFQLGLGGGYMSQPYYGRPSLVRKTGVDYHMTKYYPNDSIARNGVMERGKKTGCWKYYSYHGELLYEVDYQDSILTLNDSIKFNSKGILSDFDADGNLLHTSFIIEKFSKYDCAHTDHYEIRQLYTSWEANDSIGRMNGYVQNFYDNGTLQSEGNMKDGLPDGTWKLYDPLGNLNHYGVYHQGKRNGRWLSGDLSKKKYLGDICLNPNLPDLKEEMDYRENLLDITITNYYLGKAMNREYYDIDMNSFLSDESEDIDNASGKSDKE
jgi:antitoxin component YwqK of YwqJK toxin-antitoxin module